MDKYFNRNSVQVMVAKAYAAQKAADPSKADTWASDNVETIRWNEIPSDVIFRKYNIRFSDGKVEPSLAIRGDDGFLSLMELTRFGCVKMHSIVNGSDIISVTNETTANIMQTLGIMANVSVAASSGGSGGSSSQGGKSPYVFNLQTLPTDVMSSRREFQNNDPINNNTVLLFEFDVASDMIEEGLCDSDDILILCEGAMFDKSHLLKGITLPDYDNPNIQIHLYASPQMVMCQPAEGGLAYITLILSLAIQQDTDSGNLSMVLSMTSEMDLTTYEEVVFE